MAKMKCKANERLFNEIKNIVGENSMIIGIVQNDMIITTKELHDWEAEVDKSVKDLVSKINNLLDIKVKVFEHIKECNRKG